MAPRDSYLLRIDPKILAALRQWSEDELRSLNAQLEFLLRKSLQEAGRLPSQNCEPAKKPKGPKKVE